MAEAARQGVVQIRSMIAGQTPSARECNDGERYLQLAGGRERVAAALSACRRTCAYAVLASFLV